MVTSTPTYTLRIPMEDSKPTKTLLRDEQGGVSMARTLLLGQMLYVAAMSAAHALNLLSLHPEWWTYNGTVSVGLIAWAAGPRGLQYLGPQITNVVQMIKDAAIRRRGTDDPKTDDERGADA